MLLDLFMRRLVRIGRLSLRYADGTVRHYGGGAGPVAGMALRSRRAERRMVLNPSLAFGELYMEGEMEPEGGGLYEVLDLLVTNLWSGGTHPMEQLVARARTLQRRLEQFNPAGRARRNVAHHYDLTGGCSASSSTATCNIPAPTTARGRKRWRRRRRRRSGTSPPSCGSTGRGWRCWRSAAAGAAWR